MAKNTFFPFSSPNEIHVVSSFGKAESSYIIKRKNRSPQQKEWMSGLAILVTV